MYWGSSMGFGCFIGQYIITMKQAHLQKLPVYEKSVFFWGFFRTFTMTMAKTCEEFVSLFLYLCAYWRSKDCGTKLSLWLQLSSICVRYLSVCCHMGEQFLYNLNICLGSTLLEEMLQVYLRWVKCFFVIRHLTEQKSYTLCLSVRCDSEHVVCSRTLYQSAYSFLLFSSRKYVQRLTSC